jgi:hypothetical protein
MARLLAIAPAALIALVLAAAGCGDDDADGGFGCSGSVCKVSFHGAGEQDLSSRLGEGATVAVEAIAEDTVIVRVAGREAKLERDEPRKIGAYDVTLTRVDGDDVDLRVAKA